MSNSWPTCKLEQICSIKTGKKDVNQGNPEGKYPFFTCARSHTYSDDYSFECEALLIAGNGEVGNLNYYVGKFEAYQRTYVLMDFKGVFPRFLYYLLESRLKPQLVDQKLGNTIPYIKKGMLTKFDVPLPSIDEQKRIVAILDQAFAALDRARALAEANLADAQELFEASVERLLGCGRQGWKIGRFQDLVGEVSTGPFGSLLHKSDYIEGGTPVINPSNVVDGNIEPDWTKSVSSEAATRLDSYTLRTGDLIIGRRGEMGRCAPVLPHMEGWLCGTGSFIIRPKSGVSSEFVGYLMRTPAVVAALTSIATGATMLNLSNRAIAGMTIELPKHDEQLALLEAIRSLEGKVKLLRSEVEAKLNDLANLRQSLLQKAFSGQLT